MAILTRFQGKNRQAAILLLLILVWAAALRFVALDRVPPGLYYDEAANAVDALKTLRSGDWLVFYDTQGGKEALWMWLLAAVFSVADVGILQIRFLAAFIGFMTVGAVWWLGYELFLADKHASAADLALLSAAVLATLFVHIQFSRNGYRVLTQPLIGSLAMAALWRGIRQARWGWFVAAGALLGLAMYTYSAARFYAVLLLLFFLLQWLLSRPLASSLLHRYFWLLGAAAVAAVLVFAPMGLYFARHPDLIFHRADEVSFLNPTWNQGRPWFALFDSTWRNFGGLIWIGTENNRWNLPGRPMLDLLTAPLFLVGLGIGVWRWRRPAYLFLVMWVIVLYLPAILSYDRVPVFHRALGVVPAVGILVAVGAWIGWQWLRRHLGWAPLQKAGIVVPVLLILTVSGTFTAYDYFFRWGTSAKTYASTQTYYLDLVKLMNQEADETGVFLFPYDLRNGRFEHPNLELFYHGSAPYVSITDHEGQLMESLTETVTGREIVHVVDWKSGRSKEADPKGLVPSLLTMYGQPLGVVTDTPEYRVERFRLAAPNVDFRAEPPLQPVAIPVGDGLNLQAFSFGETGHPTLPVGNPLHVGRQGWVLLVWTVTEPTSVNYKVSVRLVAQEDVLVHTDKLLFNSFHLGTSQWHPQEENFDLYLLPLEQAGQYQIEVIVYNPLTLEQLPEGRVTLPVTVEVES